jgi:toxin ParE1/3/4
MLEIEFHEEADEELKAAAEYYESAEEGLGEAFLRSVEFGLRQIQLYPLAWSILFDDVRRYLVPRFPYALVYRIERDRVFILAVAHTRRRPRYWLGRK